MRSIARFGILLLVGAACTTREQRSAPADAATHEVARPHVVLLELDAGGDAPTSTTRFVLRGGSVFGVGKQNLLVDGGKVVAVGVADDAAERVVDVSWALYRAGVHR